MTATILILTTHFGGGHLNLAQALKEMLGSRCEGRYQVVIDNPQTALRGGLYALLSRRATKILTWQYAVTDNAPASLWLQRAQALSGSGPILRIIQRVQPQLVITTHALIAHSTACAIQHLPQPVPLVFQLTDLGQVHMTWFTEKRAAAYLAPTREIYAQALSSGIDERRLYLTGRPVRRQFYEAATINKSETLAALGFDPSMFTLFLQGGAAGSAGVDRAIKSLLASNMPMQILLAAGNNRGMAARFAGHKRVYPLPFTENIAPYMAAADVIAGKAGASFISEAFTLEKPFIVTSYIPGQESASLPFIEQHNLGWACLDPTSLQKLLASIVQNPSLLTEKLDSIRAYKAWNMQANEGICTVIERMLPSSDL